MNPLHKLAEHGQSYFIDNLARAQLENGVLGRRVERDGLRGLTSNPKTFHGAISKSSAYDAQIERSALAGKSAPEIYEDLVVSDLQAACDVLRPVFDQTEGADGFASLEVSPYVAHDAPASIAEGKRLFERVGRPNLMIKIPGTREGLVAIEELSFQGINVNVTLLFSVKRYLESAEAYVRALERRRAHGQPLSPPNSVASFFLSRIDVLVDRLLSHRSEPAADSPGPSPEKLRGKAAVANAKLAYQAFRALLDGDRWQALAREGARPQRVLWASTGTKDPGASDVKYVEPLIGPDTVTTMPADTIAAFADHGVVRETVGEGVEAARHVLEDLERLGIDFSQVTAELENEGIQKFIEPYDALLELIEEKRQRYLNRSREGALRDMAQRLRRDVVRMTSHAGSGHPTSCLSCADLVAALFFQHMRWDPADPKARDVDQFVLSKGHAAPILWAALFEAGAINDDLLSLRNHESTLEGHPTPRNPWVRVATGSLGQGLSSANGIALANRMDGIDARVYCLLGDGECSEGSVWEAAQFASLNRLESVVAIVDVNALGQAGPTPYGGDTTVLEARFRAFGWKTVVCDGHDMTEILDALHEAGKQGPTALIARTSKGKGVSFLEGELGWHGRALDEGEMRRALDELEPIPAAHPVRPQRVPTKQRSRAEAPAPEPLHVAYDPDDSVATRSGFGSALAKLGPQRPELVVLDGDVKDSTREHEFAQKVPERFVECFIAEQNMIGVALGLATAGKVPVAATFAAFLTRAHDFIRMAAYSAPAHLVLCGSHGGVSIGEDGPSQMGLEDLAMLRAVRGSTVLYPSDAVSAERLTEAAIETPGVVYLRTTRPKTPILYPDDEPFPVGGSKVLRHSGDDALTIVAAGITVHEALAAHETLKAGGVSARVIDAYSIKPIDAETLRAASRETGRLLVVEDHAPEGGLGDAVSEALTAPVLIRRLAVRSTPRSGKSSALLDHHGISRKAIVAAARELVKRGAPASRSQPAEQRH